MRTMNFDDVVTAVDELMSDGKSFTSKDVTDLLRSRGIYSMNKEVGKLLRNNWAYLSDGTAYQRTSVEVEPGVMAIMYHAPNDAIESTVNTLVKSGEPYNLKTVLEKAALADAPLMERRRISDWLRRNVPDGYSMQKDGLSNKYVPEQTSHAVLTTIHPDGKKEVKRLSKEEAEEVYRNMASEIDAAFNDAITFFNRKMSEVHSLFETVLR